MSRQRQRNPDNDQNNFLPVHLVVFVAFKDNNR